MTIKQPKIHQTRDAVQAYFLDNGKGSVTKLAEIGHCSVSTITRFKRGKRVNDDTLDRLYDHLLSANYIGKRDSSIHPNRVSEIAPPYPVEDYESEMLTLRETLLTLVEIIDNGKCTGGVVASLHGGLTHAINQNLVAIEKLVERDMKGKAS